MPSASCRTLVYKGLVTGARLPQLFPDLRAPLSVALRGLPPALRDEHASGVGPRPAVPARSPTTARSTRSAAIASRSAAGPATSARRRSRPSSLAAGPLLSPGGSDSLSLDEALELLMATGWDLTPALLAAIPEALALRRSPHPHVATLRRRTAGFLAPWDGPAAIVFADGARVGAMVDRNGLRPASFAVTRDRLVAVASEAGAVPFAATDTIRRGRLGPGELLLVEPGRRAILEDAEAKAARSGRCRSTMRRGRSTRTGPSSPPRPLAHESVPLDVQLRHLAGLDAERARLDIKTMALEGHEPLWSMGDDTPTPGRGRAGPAGRRPPPPGVRAGHEPRHRPRTRADRHGPAGRARPSAGAARRPAARARARSGWTGRSSPTSTGLLDAVRAAGQAPPPTRRHLARERRARRPGGRARAAGVDGGGRCPRPASRSSCCPTTGSISTGSRSRRSSPPAPSTRR